MSAGTSGEGIFVPYRAIFIMVIVSICINIFFLLMGILIGKDDIKWEQQQAVVPAAAGEITPGVDLDMENELSVFEQQETRAPVDIAPLEDSLAAEQEQAPEPIDPDPEPEPVRVESKPKPREVSPPTAEDLRPVESGYWIQVVALTEQDKAEQFRDRMKSGGFPAAILNEGGYYKVRVGPFQDRDRAEREKEAINTRFKVKSWIRGQ